MKKTFKIIGLVIGVLLLLLVAAAGYIKWQLPDAAPAPDILIDKSQARIERGEYLANHVTLCIDCHSTRDWSRFAGPIAPGNLGGGGEKFGPEMGFPGSFYSRNITPYSLGNWTDGEIFRAVTTGVSKDGSALFPVMPYHNYGRMDSDDIYAIIAYLRTLPSVINTPPASVADFPVNILINTMPAPATPSILPSEDELLSYGKYLTNAAACVECHSQIDKGTIIPGTEFGGGMEFPMPGGVVRSANITPDKATGIGTWTEAMFVARFKMHADSNYSAPKVAAGEMNTPMPWNMYGGMKEYDLKAIYAYLESLEPKNHKVEKFTKL
ncbi:c-type cytochrome [Dyadobacter tibetensis]|uniref:c-type cytochrome n=1 Tax=Dyadobacter tibetensis TaxID=1211851 RepID=UPI0004705C9D|nr:c-type cytochrome [Dyadobacter tibetensis]